MKQVKAKFSELSQYYFWVTIAFFTILYILRQPQSWEDKIGEAGNAVFISSLILVVFIKWGWKWKIFNWWVDQPNLNGTWKGKLHFNYPADTPIQSKDITLRIKQDYLSISVDIETDMSTSYSCLAGFTCTGDDHFYHLTYTYIHNPNAKTSPNNPSHTGTTSLKFIPDTNELKGQYWTQRKTIGDIEVTKVKQ